MARSFIILSLFLPLFLRCQQLSFVREDITMTIRGNYWFTNSSGGAYDGTLFYPFPVDSSHPFPDSITIEDITHTTIPLLSKSSEGISFPISAGPFSTQQINIEYHQRTLNRACEYILSSARYWGRPLDEALFCVALPTNLGLTSISYPFDSTIVVGGMNKYFIRKTRFSPENNLHVFWRRK